MLHACDSFRERCITECDDLCVVGFSGKRDCMEEPDDAIRAIAAVDLQWIAAMCVLRCLDLLAHRIPHSGSFEGVAHLGEDPLPRSETRLALQFRPL